MKWPQLTASMSQWKVPSEGQRRQLARPWREASRFLSHPSVQQASRSGLLRATKEAWALGIGTELSLRLLPIRDSATQVTGECLPLLLPAMWYIWRFTFPLELESPVE